MIVHYGLMLYQSKVKLAEFNHENFVNLDKELVQLIDHSSQCKHQLIQKVALSKEQVIKNTQMNADQLQLPVNPVDPVFNQLESEKGAWDNVVEVAASRNIPKKDLVKTNLGSMLWADQQMSYLKFNG